MYIALIGFGITMLGLYLLTSERLKNINIDEPNYRSLHSIPVPRLGGIAIMAGVMFGVGLIYHTYTLILILFLLTLVSTIDDFFDLPPILRLLVHVLCALSFLYLEMNNLPWYSLLMILIFIVWMTNLYNFMDGIDGLAGGMTAIGFSAYALMAFLSKDMEFALVNATVGVCAIAFLKFNFYPAKIFMGDAGSIPLGFLAGAMGMYGAYIGLWGFWFPFLLFGFFIFDASVTLAKRLIRKEKFWLPHREHYYQKLTQMGWGHKKTTLVAYILMTLNAASAIFLSFEKMEYVTLVLVLWIAVYSVMAFSIDKKWRYHI